MFNLFYMRWYIFPILLTQYKIGVQPSIVMHWKTVNMAKPMLSKDVMPLLGPCQRSRHNELPSLHQLLPWLAAWVSLSVLHGTSSSPSLTISSKNDAFRGVPRSNRNLTYVVQTVARPMQSSRVEF